MKKILLIHACDLVRGGAEKFMELWIKNAPSKAYEFTWYCMGEVSDEAYLNEIKQTGVTFIEGNIRKCGRMARAIRLYREINKLIRNGGFEIVHINSGSPLVECISIMATAEKVPIKIAHSHSLVDVYRTPTTNVICKILLPIAQAYLRNSATFCVACSTEAGMSLFGKKILHSSKWKIIQNTIDTSKFRFNESTRNNYRQKLSISSNTLVLGCVGLVNENKNQIFAIDIVNALKKEGVHNIKLILIGIDMLDGKLQKEADKMDISNQVIFLGKSNCVENWLQALDIFLMPSKSEGLPISALEAQAAGLPCVLSDRISRETQFGENVEFVSIENIALWVDIIKKFNKMEYKREKESRFVCQKEIDVSQIPKYIESLYEVDSKNEKTENI